ncbi:medium chain dehydrogenase/reductase family protein [Paenibacillus cremeus]|uniref:Zinc-binding dehydrogenase n=1 Tax=Paenibacillus cremeus TaxID=2163881 RepID=A0A559K419_9BACL|nr:medium chain dehydrogenase/reductase family protein [Paenibacillus cremeus]TVY06871.1 zinc-binding dehydrogenase [Paenibacillus cremeus]
MNTKIVVTQYGGAEALEVVEEPLRRPGKGEVRIQVQCAGVALSDIMRREGKYPGSPTPPFTPGYDAVGIVDAVGEGVHDYTVGERVCVFYHGTGGYAAYAYAPASDLVRVPESVDAGQAVAVILNYVTAYQMLHRFARVSAGDRLLIHGASGGVGTALLELGRLAETTMYGTASAAKHPIVSQYGAMPIDYRTEDFVQVVQRLAPGGVEAVFDPIGGTNWQRSMTTLSRQGRFIGYGYTSVLGEAKTEDWLTDWRALAEGQRTASGNPAYMYSITTLHRERPDWFREDLGVLFGWLERGIIDPLVSHRIPIRDAACAHQLLQQSQAAGKVVLTAL